MTSERKGGKLIAMPSVYRAVRRADHGWWRALSCCRRVWVGHWTARDAGEMRAQLELIASAVRKAND